MKNIFILVAFLLGLNAEARVAYDSYRMPSAGNLPAWGKVDLANGTTGSAPLATDLAGGLGGQVCYQNAVNDTVFLANGTAGQVLQSNGTTLAPSWLTLPASSGFSYLSANTSVYGGTNSTLTFTGAGNYISGVGAGAALTSGTNNTAIGRSALVTASTSSNSTAVGNNALNANTGASNSAFGSSASLLNSSGTDNASFGFEALRSNLTTSQNSAFGSGALRSTTSTGSAALGYQALYNNTSAYATAVGFQALVGNTSGLYNVAVGASALQTNSTSGSSTAVGTNALYTSTGASNTALGFNALQNITTGNHNIGLGTNSGNASTASTNTLFIGSTTASEGINTIQVDSTATDGASFSNKMNFAQGIGFTQIATPANPSASHNKIYSKSDDNLYLLNSAGTEKQIDTYQPEFDSGNSGTAKTLDFANGPAQKSTLTGNVTYTLSNPATGKAYVIKIVQGASAYTVTWPASVKWSGGTAPVITTTNAKIDLINLYWDGTNYYGSFSQNY